MHVPRLAAKLGLTLSLPILWAAPMVAAPGYTISTLALEGESAPGTGGDSYGDFFDVQLDENGGVAFGVPLASGFPNAGIFVDTGAGAVLRFRNGDAPPPPLPGSYVVFGSMVRLDGTGRVAASAVVNTGSGSLAGLFLDSAGVDSKLVAVGDAAPTPPSGSFSPSFSDVTFFGMNAQGDVAFRSAVTGGSAASGVFLRSAAGAISPVALLGDPVGGGPDAFQAFGYPALNDAGEIAFDAQLGGGASSAGLFLVSGGAPVALAFDGDPAPGSGGASFVDFLFPALNASGQAVFLANLSGGAASGGVFVAAPAVAAVAVEGQSVPGAGPISSVGSVPDIAGDGAVALSLSFASGPVSGGVYRISGASFARVARDGDAAPDTGGALFESFGFVSTNDAGQVAFVATLDDGRTGAFLATPLVPKVPALPLGALVVVGGLLLATARRSLARGRRA